MERDDAGSMLSGDRPAPARHAGQNHRRHVPPEFIEFSAVLSGIKEIKQVMSRPNGRGSMARARFSLSMKSTASIALSRCFSAARREGQHPADRRDHGKPVV